MILLDTHALVWMDANDDQLGNLSRTRIEQAWRSGTVAVSAVSFWECAALQARGRIRLPGTPHEWRAQWLAAGLVEIPLDGHIAVTAAGFGHPHKDPADRFIVATALHRRATLVTADARLLGWSEALACLDARK